MGKSKTQTMTQELDPASQRYVDAMRRAAQAGAGVATGGGPMFTGQLTDQDIQAAMNPYTQNVVNGVRGEFDHLRGQAATGIDQQATMSGAFGGSRHGIAMGARLGELDRAQTSQIGDLLNQGYGQALGFAEHQRALRQQQMQEPLFRQQQAMNFWGQGLGPTGGTTTQTTPGSLWRDALGVALMVGGAASGQPGVAAGGAQLAASGQPTFSMAPAPGGAMAYRPGMSGYNFGWGG